MSYQHVPVRLDENVVAGSGSLSLQQPLVLVIPLTASFKSILIVLEKNLKPKSRHFDAPPRNKAMFFCRILPICFQKHSVVRRSIIYH